MLSLLVAAGVAATGTACAQQGQPAARPVLGPEQVLVYDCKAEVTLIGTYWDRMGNRLRLDPSVYRRVIQAYQSGDIQACYAAVQETRRYLGL